MIAAILSSCSTIPTINPVGLTINNDLIDSRDGNLYPTVLVGNQRWMAQNLRWQDDTFSTADQNPLIYGQYYLINRMDSVCPHDWHLPSDAEWLEMEQYLQGRQYDSIEILNEFRGTIATKLKSTYDWTPLGTDESGLNILPVGDKDNINDPSITGTYVTYITSDIVFDNDIVDWRISRHIDNTHEGIAQGRSHNGNGTMHVCRCILD